MNSLTSLMAISLSYILLLHGCGNESCKKVYIDQNQYDWFTNLADYDTITFRGQNDSILQYTLSIDSSFSNCNRFELGDKIYQSVVVSYSDVNKENVAPIFVNIFESSSSEEKPWAYKNTRVFELSHYIESDASRKYDFKEISLRDGTKIKVHYLQDYGGKKEYIKSYCWNRQMGLVRFTTYQDEIYELDLN